MGASPECLAAGPVLARSRPRAVGAHLGFFMLLYQTCRVPGQERRPSLPRSYAAGRSNSVPHSGTASHQSCFPGLQRSGVEGRAPSTHQSASMSTAQQPGSPHLFVQLRFGPGAPRKVASVGLGKGVGLASGSSPWTFLPGVV